MPKSALYPTRREFLSAAAGALMFPGIFNEGDRPDLSAIRTRAEWRKARQKILANLQLGMGELPKMKRSPVEVVKLESEELPEYTRAKIQYLSESNDRVPAHLLVPKRLKRRAPAMLCLHQTVRIGKDEPAGLGGNADLHYARELALRGYVALAPDYPYLGENRFNPYENGYSSCTMKGIVNHIRAIDLLQSMPEVAPGRIGSIGHSLGGHNSLFVATFDERIKAIVTSCGFNSFRKYYGGDLTGWSGTRYMPRIAERYGKDPSRMPFDFSDILVALAPRPLFVNAPQRDSNFEVSGVRDCVDAAAPVYTRVFGAKEKLVAVYPDAGHEFPVGVRRAAYDFLDRWMK
jgi:hypothetical protein